MKTLYLDIETAPNLAWVWAKYEQNVISYADPGREKYCLCFSYKWEHEDETHVVSQIDFPTAFKKDKHDDSRVMQALWDLLDEADIVIGHNVRKFDLKSINAFFIRNGMTAPSPYQTVDTLVLARSNFGFNSNSLKDLAITLGLPVQKGSAGGFETWLGCMEGDADSWDQMIKYAKIDTELLPILYKRLRPFCKGLPSLNFIDPDGCPVCDEGENLLQKRGFRYTKVNRFQVWQCQSCMCYSSSRMSDLVAADKPVRVS